MIFITEHKDYIGVTTLYGASDADEPITVLNNKDGYLSFIGFCQDAAIIEIALDTETNGLDTIVADMLLLGLGNVDEQFMIDSTTVDASPYIQFCIKNNYVIVAHNAKFDYQIVLSNTGLRMYNLFDTLVTEQRILQGFGRSNKNPSGYTFRLVSSDKFDKDSVLYRYFKIDEADVDKNIRMDFPRMNKKTAHFNYKHIHYLAHDIKWLIPLKQRQLARVSKYKINKIVEIEQNLVSVLGDCEHNPLYIDVEEWLKIEKENKDLMFNKSVELDELVKSLRDTMRPKEHRKYLRGGKYDRPRIKPGEIVSTDLFGNAFHPKVLTGSKAKNAKVIENRGNVNYGSPSQIIDIFARLGQPLPTKEDTYEVPELLKDGKVSKVFSFTTGEEAMQLYVNERPKSRMIPFIETLIEFKTAKSQIDKYGKGWLEKYLQDDNKVYTIYRQCNALNGRLQSGGGKLNHTKYNSQNVPAKPRVRECFKGNPTRLNIEIKEPYEVCTADLSGAEVTIMADKANDTTLYDIAIVKDDAHSPIIQNCWRNIYLFRAGRKVGVWDKSYEFYKTKHDDRYLKYIRTSRDSKVITDYKRAQEFVVTKKVNADKRKSGKNLTFGTVYGCHAKKAAKTINVTKEEGAVYIQAVKEMIPKTFQMVERNVAFALRHGYLIIDERTQSKIWFPAVIHAKKHGLKLDFNQIREIDGEARNIPISGTQANMVKEAMVDIATEDRKRNLGIDLLLQVHDELVYKRIKSLGLIPFELDSYLNAEDILHKIPNAVITDSEILLPFGTYIQQSMIKSANRYLKHFEMKCDFDIKDSWTK